MPEMNELRKDLAPHIGKRIAISGLYSKKDLWTDYHAKRDYRTLCLIRPEDGLV